VLRNDGRTRHIFIPVYCLRVNESLFGPTDGIYPRMYMAAGTTILPTPAGIPAGSIWYAHQMLPAKMLAGMLKAR